MKWLVQCHLLLKMVKKKCLNKKENWVSDHVPQCVIVLSIDKARTTAPLAIPVTDCEPPSIGANHAFRDSFQRNPSPPLFELSLSINAIPTKPPGVSSPG